MAKKVADKKSSKKRAVQVEPPTSAEHIVEKLGEYANELKKGGELIKAKSVVEVLKIFKAVSYLDKIFKAV